jgi:hypothetical protein
VTTPLALERLRSVIADNQPAVAFCSHCARAADTESRVCDSCGLGIVLHALESVAPGPGEAFLVVEATLSVGAVSRDAERFLGTSEADSVNRPLDELIVGADSEAGGPSLATSVMWAARGDGEVRQVTIRPANTFGVRCRARIGPCGPPSAALVVLED